MTHDVGDSGSITTHIDKNRQSEDVHQAKHEVNRGGVSDPRHERSAVVEAWNPHAHLLCHKVEVFMDTLKASLSL